MTAPCKLILLVLRAYHEQRGYMPTLGELAGLCAYNSPQAAKYHLDRLVADGYVNRDGRGMGKVAVSEKGKAWHSSV